jgi:iron complex outermembrane receptor protein
LAKARLWWLVLLTCCLTLGAASMAAAQDDADDLFAEESADSDDDLFADEAVDGDDDLFADEAVEEDDDLFADEAPDAAELAEDAAPAVSDEDLDEGLPELQPLSPGTTGPDDSVEEILVQGTAGQGVEVDAAASVTAFDADDLAAMGVDDIADVAQYTPNLEIRTAGSTTATFFIRGVGLNDFTANASGSVAIYQDNVALNLPAIQVGQIFDTENLEILKGPQGAGPGRNASAGAIYVHSRKPSGETGGFLRVDRGNFGFIDTEAAVEVPLLADTLSTRVAYRYSKRDGLVDNRCGGLTEAEVSGIQRPCGNITNPRPKPGLEEKLNDIDTWAARGQVRFLPPDTDLELLLNVHGGRIDQNATVGQHIGTQNGLPGSADRIGYRQPEIFNEFQRKRQKFLDQGLGGGAANREARVLLAGRLGRRAVDKKPFEGDYNVDGFERMDTIGGFVRANLELDRASLSSTTGAERYTRDRLVDADYSPNRLFEFAIDDDAWQVTQDLRAEGELDEVALTWKTGVYYLQEELDYSQITLAGDSLTGVDQAFVQKTWSWGAYGGFTWQFADDFELEIGARYNWERKGFEVDITRGGFIVCAPDAFGRQPDCGEQRRTFSEPTGTAALRWHMTDEISAYWKYSHGWKGAQFNARDGTVRNIAIDVARPERIDAYEFGFRAAWWDGRLTVDSAFFWYDYEDYQVFTFTNDADTPPQRIVLNANDAQLYGAELEMNAEPLDRLLLTLRFGWLESKFLDFTDTGSRLIAGTGIFFEQVIDYNGNRLPNTPRFKLSGGVEYELDLTRFGSITPRWDFAWTDDFAFDPAEGRGTPRAALPGRPPTKLPQHTVGQKAYILHNFRLTYKAPGGNIELAGWVRNITNEVYKNLAFDASQSVGFVGNLIGEPRTYGGSISLTF